MDHPLLNEPLDATDYEAARAAFRWPRPERFNIAEAICGQWARREPDRVAILHLKEGDRVEEWTYGRLERESCRLANALEALGVARGDRCGVLLPQRPETTLAHLAVYRMGAIALPLFTLFGEEALVLRLRDAGAKALITDAANLSKVAAIRDQLPDLETVLCVDGPWEGALAFWETLASAKDSHQPVDTLAEDPGLIIYTSGTTGPPKGALHAHRVLIGHLPGVQMWLEGLPRPGDVCWTPADWAWIGGLCNTMMPSLLYGVPLVAHRMAKFDPDRAYWLWERFGVTVGFMPPTALKLMRQAPEPSRYALKLRALGSGGEPLGPELLDWGRRTFGLTINEFYGQTECNLVVSNAANLMPVKPGAMGKAALGCEIGVLDAEGGRLPPGEAGEIAVRKGHPSMFLGYWNNLEATEKKVEGDWLRTGDEGSVDAEGYVTFLARADDVITSAGYRIGPGEIEDCLAAHPSVAMAGVFGAPDPIRGEAVAAFVVPAAGAEASPDLEAALQAHVKERLGPHEYPRAIRFLEALPMTATGKIMRRELRRRFSEETPGKGA